MPISASKMRKITVHNFLQKYGLSTVEETCVSNLHVESTNLKTRIIRFYGTHFRD